MTKHSIDNSPKVALMQPTFWPWLGYFGLIYDSDIFVFLDSFQFARQSFGHRNSLLLNNQKSLITLPVSREGSHKESYLETSPVLTPKFIKKTLRSIDQNYSFSPWLDIVINFLTQTFESPPQSLADLNISFIRWACDVCGIKSDFRRSSEIDIEISDIRSKKVLNILQYYNAKTYLCARGSFDYMSEDAVFPVPGIDTQFQSFAPVTYLQNKGKSFVSHLSILDAILQVGPEETFANIAKTSNKYQSWNEMLEQKKSVQ